jgi:hypothetical protein
MESDNVPADGPVIIQSATEFAAAFAALPPPGYPATARAAFLVAPAGHALAAESASDNAYMRLDAQVDADRALAQHQALAQALRADCPVISFPGDATTPDAIFPNNVFATTPGRLIIGRMRHAVRRAEAGRGDIRAFFRDVLGYAEVDLSARTDLVAELTGALVVDRGRRIGYCGLGERCNLAGASAMAEAFGLRFVFCFELAPGEYHANVVLSLLAGRGVILAADGFRDPAVPAAIARAYPDCVVWLTPAQNRAFAGNAITLNDRRVWMSQRAADALDDAQRDTLAAAGFTLGTPALDELEKAGGSLRCCVAEIY